MHDFAKGILIGYFWMQQEQEDCNINVSGFIVLRMECVSDV